jgi:hypothetical protein
MEKKNIKWSISWGIGRWDEGKNFNIWSNGWDTPIVTICGSLLLKSTPPT